MIIKYFLLKILHTFERITILLLIENKHVQTCLKYKNTFCIVKLYIFNTFCIVNTKYFY